MEVLDLEFVSGLFIFAFFCVIQSSMHIDDLFSLLIIKVESLSEFGKNGTVVLSDELFTQSFAFFEDIFESQKPLK